jgi:hypothetical protein
VKNYSFKKVVLTWGPYQIKGFMSGSSIAVDMDEDQVTKDIGADGEGCRILSSNQGGSITVTLQQSSSSNDDLSAEHAADVAGVSGPGGGRTYPLMLKDLNGTTLHMSPEAWLTKPAPNDWAKEFSGRQWKFDCVKLLQFVGGASR